MVKLTASEQKVLDEATSVLRSAGMGHITVKLSWGGTGAGSGEDELGRATIWIGALLLEREGLPELTWCVLHEAGHVETGGAERGRASNWLQSRRWEFECDAFAIRHGADAKAAQAHLKRLSVKNRSLRGPVTHWWRRLRDEHPGDRVRYRKMKRLQAAMSL